ncbi:MAG: ADP-ribosylation factor-like protein [Candidatus Helarchaeota archaeon]
MTEAISVVLKKLSSILNVPKPPKTIKEILNLPAWTLNGVEKEDALLLDDKLGVTTISDLVGIDLNNIPKNIGIKLEKLERWVAAARIAARSTKMKPLSGKKIIIIGLDNAGKSAILELIKNKPQGSFQKFSKTLQNLKPTKGVNRESLNFHNLEFSVWDMGGQKDYRKQYLDKPDYFFVQTDILHLVIDVQDKNRHEEALAYFDKILSMMDYLKETPYVMVLLHKADPEKTFDTSLIAIEMKNLLKKYPNFKYDICKTSIFDEASVFRAFSDGFKHVSSHEKVISGIIGEYTTKLGIYDAVLVDGHGFEISRVADGKDKMDNLYNLTMYAGDFCANIGKTSTNGAIETDKLSFHLLPENKYFIMLRLLINNENYFLGMIHDDEHKVIETQSFSESLMPWLENLFV